MNNSNPAPIWIVEDDHALADSLRLLFASAGMPETRHFASADECLVQLQANWSSTRLAGCMLLDIRMPGMSGTELFAKLKALEWPWPVIFMTGHGDLQMAVNLLRQGAFDYVTKPCDPMELVAKVTQALQVSREQVTVRAEQQMHLDLLSKLTKHEQWVFQGILSNKTNREIAEEMNNSTRTIESHRANILKKMAVGTALELAQVHERFLLRGGKLPFDQPK